MTAVSHDQSLCDPRLQGAKYCCVIAASPGSVAVSCRDARRVLLLTQPSAPPAPFAIVADSGDLGSPTGRIIKGPNGPYVLCSDGQVRRLDPATLALLATQQVYGTAMQVLTASSTWVIASYRQGGFCTLDPLTLAIKDRAEGVATEVQLVLTLVVGGAQVVYAFDGHGLCKVFTINASTGVIAAQATIPAPGCQGLVDGFAAGGNLLIIAKSGARVIQLTPDTVTGTTFTTIVPSPTVAPKTIQGVLNGDLNLPPMVMTDEEPGVTASGVDLPMWAPSDSGVAINPLSNTSILFTQSRNARIQVSQ